MTMSPLEVLLGKGLEEKHDRRYSQKLALSLGRYLAVKEEKIQAKVVEAINNTLTKLAESDEEFAILTINELRTNHPEIHQKYPFQLN